MRKLLFLLSVAVCPILTAEQIDLLQTPPLVRDAIGARLGANQPSKIDVITENGLPTYVVTFADQNQPRQLRVDQNGTFIAEEAIVPPANPIVSNPTPLTAVGPAGAAPAPQPFLASSSTNTPLALTLTNSQRIHLTDVPLDVRSAFRSLIGSGRLNDISRGTSNGRTIYQIIFTEGGRNLAMQLDENGNVLYDQRATVIAPQAAAPGSPLLSKFKKQVPLSAPQPLQTVDLPPEVEAILTPEVGAAAIDHLIWGIWNGQRVYQATFKWNGQNVTLQLDDFGNVLYDSRSSASPTP
jgi:hypothetical protein